MHAKRNEILIIGLGTTPQVVTEVLYYYTHPYYQSVRRFDRILIYTTLGGRVALEQSLAEGWLNQMERVLQLDQSFSFNPDRDIIIYEDEAGNQLPDMRSTASITMSLKKLYQVFQEYSGDANTRITATVAGGRKSMSAAMALAFQLYAREQDELIHIMVPDSLLNVKDWYFPTDPADPNQLLEVTQIPVVKVGRYLPLDSNQAPDLLLKDIESHLKAQEPLKKLIVNRTSFSDGIETFKLPPREASYFRLFLKHREKSTCKPFCPGCENCTISFSDLMESASQDRLDEYGLIVGKESDSYLGALAKHKKKLETNDISDHLTYLRKSLAKANISARFHEQLTLKNFNFDETDRRYRRYGILIDPRILEWIK